MITRKEARRAVDAYCKDTAARLAVEGVRYAANGALLYDILPPANDNVPVAQQPARKERLYRNTEPRDGFAEDGIVPVDKYGPPSNGGKVFPEPRRGDWMQLYSGKQFWPMDPRSDEIEIEDIAHSLSMQCRYAGHCLKFYSVAEHSVHIAQWLWESGYDGDTIMAGLLHDATEAYLVDVPRPVKPFLEGYKRAELSVWCAVAERFGLPVRLPEIVKEADTRIIGDERANMKPCVAEWYATGSGLGVGLEYWAPEVAEKRFFALFRLVQRLREREVGAPKVDDDYYPAADREASAADRAYQTRMEDAA